MTVDGMKRLLSNECIVNVCCDEGWDLCANLIEQHSTPSFKSVTLPSHDQAR
ncbi:unnamed protein product [Clavelina lepadiformis]|uniref:Uncharacterized protein n=1 Tax=Clavelina lepadiformis TaxID=159417 RepID=A0ABP0F3J3_CLALP